MTNDISAFWDILKIVLPALIVFITAYFLFRDMLENSQKQREFEFKVLHAEKITPVRLQAYERLTLFLERIAPQSLLMRISPHQFSVTDYQQELLRNIRQEYEHNLSQQIYVSPILWETIRGAKEQLIAIVNKSAEEMEGKASAIQLSKKIFENYMNEEHQPVQIALNELRREVSKLF